MTQKVMLIGHLGVNAEIVPVSEEREVAKFTLATKELFPGRDPHTEWHNVSVYGKKGSFAKLIAAGKLNAGAKATLLDGVNRSRSSEKDGKKAYFYGVEFQLNPNTTMFELPANRSAQGAQAAGQGQAGQGQEQAAGQGQAGQGQEQAAGQGQASGQAVKQEPSQLELARAKAAEAAQAAARLAQEELEIAERQEQERLAREEQARLEQARQVQQPQAAPPVYNEPPMDFDDDIPF